MIIAVGWPGQLATRFIRDKENGLRIRAGQELTHFKLLPGEEVRTPLVALQFWKGGDWLRARTSGVGGSSPTTCASPAASCRPRNGAARPTIGGGLMEGVTEENCQEMHRCLRGAGLEAGFLVDGRRLVSLRRRVAEHRHVGSRQDPLSQRDPRRHRLSARERHPEHSLVRARASDGEHVAPQQPSRMDFRRQGRQSWSISAIRMPGNGSSNAWTACW